MSSQKYSTVEFIGGPVDGAVLDVALPLHAFIGVKSTPSGGEELRSFFRWLFRGMRALRVPLAIYELDDDCPVTYYRYRGSRTVTRRQLRKGCGLATVGNAVNSTAAERCG